jgi:hypothetical protein
MVMSANARVVLSLISCPGIYTDPDLSARVRDSVHAAILTAEPATTGKSHDADNPAATRTAAAAFDARLRRYQPTVLTAEECALLHQWLATLATAPAQTGPKPTPTASRTPHGRRPGRRRTTLEYTPAR